MALHTHDLGRPQGLPFEAVLASIPSYPRPVIERLVSRLIDTLDEQDAATMDMEDDDPAGGNVEDVGELLNNDDEPDLGWGLQPFERGEVRRIRRAIRRRARS